MYIFHVKRLRTWLAGSGAIYMFYYYDMYVAIGVYCIFRNFSVPQYLMINDSKTCFLSTQLESFMASHLDPDLEDDVDKIKKKINKNRTWLEVNLEPIHQWLIQVNTGNGTTSATHVRRRRKRSCGTDIDVTRGDFAEVRLRSEF